MPQAETPLALERDGRRRRTLDSRARIISAMLELTREGHVAASAESVAERARVGLRTVFRHFRDMDSLYREMSLIMEARFAEEAGAAFTSADWRGRLSEMIGRRAGIFEKIAPFKRAQAAQRHSSRFLDSDARRLNQRLREALHNVLPADIRDDERLFETLDLLLSFESWDRLRREQGLSVARARAALEHAVATLLA